MKGPALRDRDVMSNLHNIPTCDFGVRFSLIADIGADIEPDSVRFVPEADIAKNYHVNKPKN